MRNRLPLCKKVLKYNKGAATIKDVQNALKEFEVMQGIDHPCICETVYPNKTEEPEVTTKGRKETVTMIALFIEFAEFGLGEVLV